MLGSVWGSGAGIIDGGGAGGSSERSWSESSGSEMSSKGVGLWAAEYGEAGACGAACVLDGDDAGA